MQFGRLQLDLVRGPEFRLDGGAMFGVVPKVLWERKFPADEKNRITLGLNCMLVTAPDGRRALCDTGMGDRWSDKERSMYAIDHIETLEGSLAQLGLGVADVDF